MATTCVNCGTFVIDKFCPHCRQKVEVSRLTWHRLGKEIFHFFTHIEKEFFETALQLIIRPGSWAFYAAVDFYKRYAIKYVVLKTLIALVINIFTYFLW